MALKYVVFNTAGTYTWVCPGKVTDVLLLAIGGGGGGAGGWQTALGQGIYGVNGSFGQNIFDRVSVVPQTTYTIVVGAAGAGGAVTSTGVFNNGFDGTSTSFAQGSSILSVASNGLRGIGASTYEGTNPYTGPGAGGNGSIVAQGLPATAGKAGNAGELVIQYDDGVIPQFPSPQPPPSVTTDLSNGKIFYVGAFGGVENIVYTVTGATSIAVIDCVLATNSSSSSVTVTVGVRKPTQSTPITISQKITIEGGGTARFPLIEGSLMTANESIVIGSSSDTDDIRMRITGSQITVPSP